MLTWPLSSSVNLGWQANAFLKLSAQYQFRFSTASRGTTTDESFVVPPSTTTHGIGAGRVGISPRRRLQRGGERYAVPALGLEVHAGRRGCTTDRRAERRRYAKHKARSPARDFRTSMRSRSCTSTQGSSAAGDLDRFSRYQFGIKFDDTRIHGVPASGRPLRRPAHGARQLLVQHFRVVRYRLDLFLEQAWGTRPAVGAGLAAADRHGRRREYAHALEYHASRGLRSQLPARPLQRASGRRRFR